MVSKNECKDIINLYNWNITIEGFVSPVNYIFYYFLVKWNQFVLFEYWGSFLKSLIFLIIYSEQVPWGKGEKRSPENGVVKRPWNLVLTTI